MPLTYDLQLDTVIEGYDRQTCWVHARCGVIPDGPAVLTAQKLRLSGSDIFYCIHDFRSEDSGRAWTGPTMQLNLDRRLREDGCELCPCDQMPQWHAPSQTLLTTGHTAIYRGDELSRDNYNRSTAYSVYDPNARCWSPWQSMSMPDPDKFYNCGAGCAQRVDLPDGDVLLPVSFLTREESAARTKVARPCTVLRCSFDGQELKYVAHGDELHVDVPRGVYEPSLTEFGGIYFLTMRNDQQGYVSSGHDGLCFGKPKPWTYDDGAPLGNYNTQQH